MRSLEHSLLTVLLVTGLIFGNTCASAAGKDGHYKSQGGASCSSYLEGIQPNSWPLAANGSYVAGYVTAFNLKTPDTYNILGSSDFNGVLLWIKNYCERNPLKHISDALETLTDELYQNRLKKAP